MCAHREHGVDAPGPEIRSPRRMLDADRPDLELAVLALEDHAVVVVGLGVDDFAQIESQCASYDETGRRPEGTPRLKRQHTTSRGTKTDRNGGVGGGVRSA